MYRFFYNKFDFKTINDLDDLRGDVKRLYLLCVKKFPNESAINSNFDALVETLHGAIKPRISLELSKNN